MEKTNVPYGRMTQAIILLCTEKTTGKGLKKINQNPW